MSTGHDGTASSQHPDQPREAQLTEEDLKQVSGGGNPFAAAASNNDNDELPTLTTQSS